MADAANQIDRLLRADPATQGVAAGGSLRLLTVKPLSVLYSKTPDDLKVVVWAVRGEFSQ